MEHETVTDDNKNDDVLKPSDKELIMRLKQVFQRFLNNQHHEAYDQVQSIPDEISGWLSDIMYIDKVDNQLLVGFIGDLLYQPKTDQEILWLLKAIYSALDSFENYENDSTDAEEDSFESQLLRLAIATGATLEIERDKDDWFHIASIERNDDKVYVWLKRYGDRYIPIDFNGDGLYREMYDEPFDEYDKARERGNEILMNLDHLLSGTIHFHPKPTIFNKNRGYIELPIDGKKIRINQKRNFYDLPTSEA